MKSKVTVIAIDRAEGALKRACKLYETERNVVVKGVMLVSQQYKKTPAYKGDETDGFFEEVCCDFDDSEALKKTIIDLADGQIIFHCRLEEAIQDYIKVVTLFPDNFCQTPAALQKSTQKYKMRDAISKKYPKISPKFIEVTSSEDIQLDDLNSLSYPVIIKPNGLHSSFLVKKCLDSKDAHDSLINSFAKLQQVYEREYGTGKPTMLVEEFMEGEMYSIDAYVLGEGNYHFLPPIRVITAAELGLDGYYSYRHIIPTRLSQKDIESANICASQAMSSIGLTFSSAHIELYHTSSGWKIIEIGPRIGGYRQELYYQAFGIEHYYNDLLVHSGINPNTNEKWSKHAAGFNIYADREGLITDIQGIQAASKLPSTVSVELNCQLGSKSIFASNGGQFLVDGILSNEDPIALEKDMKKLRELIKIKVS